MNSNEYINIINEYVDIHSKDSLLLLKLNENEKEKVLDKIAVNIYDSVNKIIDKVDYGDIPDSKGDITKLSSYKDIKETATNIRALLLSYPGMDLTYINELNHVLTNVEILKPQFELGFRADIDMIKFLYNNIVMAIMGYTSELLNICIDYIVSPETNDSDIHKANGILYKNINSFNRYCESGKMKKLLSALIREKEDVKSFVGFVGVGGLLVIGVITCILPIIRNLVYFFYYSRVTTSDYLDLQSQLLKKNVLDLKDQQRKDKGKIIKKQNNIIKSLNKLSDKIRVKHSMGTNKVIKMDKKEEKLNIHDLEDKSQKIDSLF